MNQSANRDSIQARWLADFLDWYDSLARRNDGGIGSSIKSDARDLIDTFLREVADGQSVDDSSREALLTLASDMLSAKHLIGDAVGQWLDPTVSADFAISAELEEEVFPRAFGDYELLERAGHGGMGVVYRARQISLGRIVCIKMLPPSLLEPRRMRRFTEESQLAGALHHPGIVPVFNAGYYSSQPFYVMEFVEGETLAQLIAGRPLTARDAAAALCDVADAVQFAHDTGVLHLDLKPANVLIDRRGRLRVTDFGLARQIDVAASEACVAGIFTEPAERLGYVKIDGSASEARIAGTPSYMATEQARGQPVDRRTDVYGLGAVLYEMLSGRPPHVGNSPVETMRLVAEEPPVRLAQLRPGTPRDLETICHKCLEKNPRRRYESAASLRDDLGRFLRHEPVLARQVGSVERVLRWTQRHPAVATASLVSFLSVLALLVGGTLALLKTQAALERTRTAERTQRRLAGELATAKEESEAALYRSLIMQATRSLETLDVDAARNSLKQINALVDFAGSPPLEYQLLYRQAYSEFASIDLDGAAIRDAAWTGTGEQIIALLDDGNLAAFDQDGVIQTQKNARGSVRAFAVHPNQPVAATSDQDGNVSIWSTSPLELRSQITTLPALALHLAWHPSRLDLIALSDDGAMRKIAVESGEMTLLAEFPERPSRFALTPDGAWIAVATQSNDIFALQLDALPERIVERGKAAVAPVASTDGWIADLAWTMDRRRPAHYRLAAADERGSVHLWDFTARDTVDASSFREILSTSSGPAGGVSLSWRDGELIVGHSAGQLTAIDFDAPSVRWRHACQPVQKVVSQQHGARCLLLYDDSLGQAIWDLNELGVGVPVYSSNTPLRSITTGDSGRLTAWRDTDGQVGIVTARQLENVTTIRESAVGASALAASPSRPLLAVTRGSDVLVYHAPSLEPLVHFTEHESTVWMLAFSRDSEWLATGDGAGQIGLVCLDHPEESRLLATLEGEVRALAFSPNGRRLAAMDSSGQLTIWNTATWEHYQGPRLAGVTAHSLAFTQQAEIVIGDTVGRIHFVDLSANLARRTSDVHHGPVWSLAAIESRIISSGQDGSICISDASGHIYHRLPKQSSAVWSVAYDPSAGYLWAATVSGQALRWQTRVNRD